MSVKQVLQLESESVSCQPVTIPFEFTRLESLPEGKTVGDSIAITPITVRIRRNTKSKIDSPYYIDIQ